MKTVKYWIKLRWLTLQWQQVRSPPGSPYSTPPETPRWEMVESLRRCRPWGPSSSPGPQHDPETQPLFINHLINMADYTMSSGGLVCNPPLCICQDSDGWSSVVRYLVFSDIFGGPVVCTSGVSAGHTIPHSVLCSCLGFASLPSLPIGELTRRRWDRVEAKVRRFNTYKQKNKRGWCLDAGQDKTGQNDSPENMFLSFQ